MSRKIIANPYTGEKLKEPFIVYEDHVLCPEDFYSLETVKDKSEDDLFPDEDLVHPTHYTSYDPEIDISCIDAMRAAFGKEAVKDGLLQNAFEYIWRSSSKGKNLDIQKAINELSIFLKLGGYE